MMVLYTIIFTLAVLAAAEYAQWRISRAGVRYRRGDDVHQRARLAFPTLVLIRLRRCTRAGRRKTRSQATAG
jgi:hypothetical protein